MASKLARMLAAQAWQADNTRHIEMNSDLAEAFAEILDRLNVQDELQKMFPDEKPSGQLEIKWEKEMDRK